MGKDQTRLRAPRQAERHQAPLLRMHDLSCNYLEMGIAVDPLPLTHGVSGIPVRQSGLAEDRMLKQDGFRVVLLDGDAALDEAPLDGLSGFDNACASGTGQSRSRSSSFGISPLRTKVVEDDSGA